MAAGDYYPRDPKDRENAVDVAMQGRFLMKPKEWARWAIRFVRDWRPPTLARGEPPGVKRETVKPESD